MAKIETIATGIVTARHAAIAPVWHELQGLFDELQRALVPAIVQIPGHFAPQGPAVSARKLHVALNRDPDALAALAGQSPPDPSSEAASPGRMALCRLLRRLKVLRGLGHAVDMLPGITPALASLHARGVASLSKICAIYKDTRINIGAKRAKRVRHALGLLEQEVNAKVVAKLKDESFLSGASHSARAVMAEREAIAETPSSTITFTANVQAAIKYRTRVGWADEALRVSTAHAQGKVASEIADQLLAHLRGGLGAPSRAVLHRTTLNKHSPLPYRHLRGVQDNLLLKRPAPGLRPVELRPHAVRGGSVVHALRPKKLFPKDLLQDGARIANPAAKTSPQRCLCGNPYCSGDKHRKYTVITEMPGATFTDVIDRRIIRPDGASVGQCCNPRLLHEHRLRSTEGPGGIQSPPSFPPAISRNGLLVYEAILTAG